MFPLFLVLIVIMIFFRILAGGWDRSRIADYIEDIGGRVADIEWTPFGKGWLGSEHERIYMVMYLDATGARHQAICKTSMLSGVYFTEDTITSQPGKEFAPLESLRDENRRLREELRRIKGK